MNGRFSWFSTLIRITLLLIHLLLFDILATQCADDGEMLGVADPHFWLDPNNMMKMADKIKSKLISSQSCKCEFL